MKRWLGIYVAITAAVTAILTGPAVGAESDAGRSPVEPKTLPAPDQAVEKAEPAIRRLDDGRLALGEILLDPKTRELRFPAEVNMTEGLLEFIIVHQDGKIHESLLHTRISPTKLNVGLKLLDYTASPELYFALEEDGSFSNEFETATEEQRKGSRLKIEVEWKDGERTRRHPINEWVAHAVTEQAMPAEAWIYGGSRVRDGRYEAEGSGDIAAIFLSRSAMINFSGKDNFNDEVWFPFAKRVPPVGTPVTVILSPQSNPS